MKTLEAVKKKSVRFNEERVKATLAGIKTQFRRVDNKYSVGDILFVQETYAVLDGKVIYKADNSDYTGKWIPSLFMPLEAARLFLEVVNVREEKLQDITWQDADKEGLEIVEHNCYRNYLVDSNWFYKGMNQKGYHMVEDPVGSFASRWDSENIKNNGPRWKDNPGLSVVEFKVLEIKK